MRHPVKVGITRSLIRCNPEGNRRVRTTLGLYEFYYRHYIRQHRLPKRTWKEFRRHQWKVKGIERLPVLIQVNSIRNPEYQEAVEKMFPIGMPYDYYCQYGWYTDDDDCYHDVPDAFVDVWDTQAEEKGLWKYGWKYGYDCTWDEVYEYEYRDTFIDDGEYFGTHGWDICALANYEQQERDR